MFQVLTFTCRLTCSRCSILSFRVFSLLSTSCRDHTSSRLTLLTWVSHTWNTVCELVQVRAASCEPHTTSGVLCCRRFYLAELGQLGLQRFQGCNVFLSQSLDDVRAWTIDRWERERGATAVIGCCEDWIETVYNSKRSCFIQSVWFIRWCQSSNIHTQSVRKSADIISVIITMWMLPPAGGRTQPPDMQTERQTCWICSSCMDMLPKCLCVYLLAVLQCVLLSSADRQSVLASLRPASRDLDSWTFRRQTTLKASQLIILSHQRSEVQVDHTCTFMYFLWYSDKTFHIYYLYLKSTI